MATVISHALVAGSLASVVSVNVSRVRLTCVLGVLAMLPDLDVIGFRLGIPYGHVLGHRGFTHSLLFAALTASVVPPLLFRHLQLFSRDWRIVFLLAFIATASHGAIDSFTDAGVGVGFLIPFDDTRYFAPWRPLATSPLSIVGFFSGPALRILANEFVWIGLPMVGLLGMAKLTAWACCRREARRFADTND